jgi:hypothetical protein
MNELGDVVAGGQTNMNGMVRAGASIIIFEPLSQCMCSYANNGIQLWIKRLWAAQRVHRNAVLLDFVDGSFEVLLANKSQKANKVIRPTEYARRHNRIDFSPLGLKLADCRLQVITPY